MKNVAWVSTSGTCPTHYVLHVTHPSFEGANGTQFFNFRPAQALANAINAYIKAQRARLKVTIATGGAQ